MLALITGSQNRHLAIAQKIIDRNKVIWIHYQRKLVPQEGEREQFLEDHLKRLRKDEERIIGKYDFEKLKTHENVVEVISVRDVEEFNGEGVIKRLDDLDVATYCSQGIVYGSGIIRKKLKSVLPQVLINIHGGISPYYKGSSTLLYALIMGQPELMGMTIHEIDEGIDSGQIYTHVFPKTLEGLSITEMFAQCQLDLNLSICDIVNSIRAGELVGSPQSRFGRTYMERDYRVSHLRSAYSLLKQGLLEVDLKTLEQRRSMYKVKPWR